ncbi:hypothetical protein HY624_03960 [Candidatus Uhrbacteria bacterium]|nr:hypothetical protein [Candidatus Uhrbacteria bacterium]
MDRQRFYIIGGIGIMVVAVIIVLLIPRKSAQTRELELTTSREQTELLRERLERLETLRWIITDETFQRIPKDLEMIAANTKTEPAN